MRAVTYAKEGVLMHFFNDEAIVKALTSGGHTISDARNYGVVGCLEPNAQGKTYGSTFAVQFNGIKCLELALSNGIDNTFGYQVGPRDRRPREIHDIRRCEEGLQRPAVPLHRADGAGHDLYGSGGGRACAVALCLGDDRRLLDKGMDATEGGAVYNSTGVQFMGFANVADSLYAVKKTVFDEKVMTMASLPRTLPTIGRTPRTSAPIS